MKNPMPYSENQPYGSVLRMAPKFKTWNSTSDTDYRGASNVTPFILKFKSDTATGFEKTHLQEKQIRSQAEHHLSIITDPLWERICSEVAKVMGSFAVLKISGCRLGALSSRDSTLTLYCPTADVVHFIKKYAFVILGELQKYFPKIKWIQAKTSHT